MQALFLLIVTLFSASVVAMADSTEEDTPVTLQDFFGSVDMFKARDFAPPIYSSQEGRIGYFEGVFGVPTGMEERVSFWLDIYTKYTTDQGLLHDSEYVHLVYEDVDFRSIMKDASLTDSQKRKARRKLVKEAKKRIRRRLLKLSKLKSPAGLEGEDLRYWYLFKNVEGKNKFRKASRKGRLRFQLGQKDRMIEGIYHAGKYIDQMEEIFREYNLPKELVRMVFVESSFNPKAVSKVGASGMWQFMRYTARQYMKVNWSVDERNDPLTATRAAAKKLRNNYKMLESWPLAVTGYNHGPNGVRRMVKKYKTTDISELTDVRRGRFGFASANFYATFLAALEAEKNATKYYGKLKTAHPLKSEKLKLDKNIDLKTMLKFFDGNIDLAKEFNLHLRPRFWNGKTLIKKGHFVRVKAEKLELARATISEMKVLKGPVASGDMHKVQRGETLSEIALRFGVSLRALKEVNEISNPRRVRAGQKLIIPQ